MSNPNLAEEPLFINPDLYGLLVTEPLQLDSNIDGCGTVLLTMCRLLFLALATFGTQLLTASRMSGLAMQKEGAQCPSKRLSLQVICVFVISASLVRKMRDIANLAYLLLMAPVKLSDAGPSPFQERRMGFGDRLAHAWAKRRQSGGSMNWSLDPITTCWKVFSLLCVVLPRFLLAMFIAKAGAYLVVRTDPECAIVDTIAVLFIGDLDSFLLTTFTASSTKQLLAEAEPVLVYVPERHNIISFVGSNLVGPLLAVAMTATLVSTMLRSCTGDSAVGNSAVSGSPSVGSPMMNDLTGTFTFW